MSNASLRPSKSANHRDTRSPTMKSTDITTLNIKRARCGREASLTNFDFVNVEKSAFECSYEVAYRAAKCKSRTPSHKNL